LPEEIVMMRTSKWVLGSLGIVLALLLVANMAAAAQTTLTSNTPFTMMLTADDGDSISLTWSSNASVRCWVTDPGGSTVYDETGLADWLELISVDSTGTYTLHWQRQVSTDVSLTYDASVVPFGNIDDAFDAAFWGLVIAGLVIVAVIIVVVVVVLMGDRKKKAASQAQTQPYAGAPAPAPAAVPAGTCPYCGSAVDPQYVFCQKCGGKVR
jgi:hypothetical protein